MPEPRTPAVRAPSGDASRRRWPRLACRRPVVLFPNDGHAPRNPSRRRHVAKLLDYGRQGIGMSCPVRLPAGSQFVVRVIGADERPVPIVFTVAHCKQDDAGQFNIGASLTYVPGTPRPAPAAIKTAADTLPMVTSAQLAGKTVSNWDRVLDLRIEGERVWVCPHPPDRQGSGWGVFVDRKDLNAALDRLS